MWNRSKEKPLYKKVKGELEVNWDFLHSILLKTMYNDIQRNSIKSHFAVGAKVGAILGCFLYGEKPIYHSDAVKRFECQ